MPSGSKFDRWWVESILRRHNTVEKLQIILDYMKDMLIKEEDAEKRGLIFYDYWNGTNKQKEAELAKEAAKAQEEVVVE